jgi:hypothetical protein
VARSLALPRPPAGVRAAAARWLPLAVAVAAAVALAAGEFLTFRVIRAVTAVPPGGTTTGGAHHGYALAVVAVAVLPMAWGATIGGSRPAAAALTVLGAVALAIVLAVDMPTLDDTGLIGQSYDLAAAHPATGFWVQLAAAAALLMCGALLLRARLGEARERSERRHRERRVSRA